MTEVHWSAFDDAAWACGGAWPEPASRRPLVHGPDYPRVSLNPREVTCEVCRRYLPTSKGAEDSKGCSTAPSSASTVQDAAASSAPADTQQLGRELTSPPPADLGGVHLWDELGTPRQAHVACPGCRESDEVGSHFDSAWCCHCGWRGSLTAMREPLSVERVALLRALEQRACCLMWDDAPYVCPGCYAIGGESCAADCPDAAIERDREERIERDWDGEVDGD